MGLWRPPGLGLNPTRVVTLTLTLAFLAATTHVTSSLDQAVRGSQPLLRQPEANQAVLSKQSAGTVVKTNEIPNIYGNKLPNNQVLNKVPENPTNSRRSGYKASSHNDNNNNNGPPPLAVGNAQDRSLKAAKKRTANALSEDESVILSNLSQPIQWHFLRQQSRNHNKPKALAQQQKERFEETVRLNQELQNKLRVHEGERARKEQEFQDRELQRQQRQRMLEDFRKAESSNARREAQGSQRDKEQTWVDEVGKSIANYKQHQDIHQQQQPNQDASNLGVKVDNPANANNENGQLSRREGAAIRSGYNNTGLNSNKALGGDSGNQPNIPNLPNNNRPAHLSNSRVVKEPADLESNNILPAVKYPRDDVAVDSKNVNQNGYINNNGVHNLDNNNVNNANLGQHDSPEVANANPNVIQVEERQGMAAGGGGGVGGGVRNDINPNANDNNNNNNFNNFNDNLNQDNLANQNGNANFPDNGAPNSNLEGQLGGLHINWDWDDFSIMFDNYGRAEMKVRRAPKATTGEPWPMPQYYSKKEKKVFKISKDLRFVPTGMTCDVLEEAMSRHLQRVLRGSVEDMYDNLQNAEGTYITDPALRYEKEEFVKAHLINRVELKVRKACSKYPALESDESYDLVVKKKKTFIYANEVWGMLRGLETLGQLVWRGTDGVLYIKETVISDYPRFSHRGLHIDTSRHYLFKEVLYDIIDSMEMNKLNVFHWHIVDDQSFPYESKVFPELSRKGAFHPTYVYSLEDITELIEYARVRGVRVLPEFDTPGHTYAWGLGRPELLTQCYSEKSPVKGYLGPLDPSKNSTYRFLHSLFQEIMGVFKDPYIHLGGDEVPLGCWQSNPEVMAFANELARKTRGDQSRQAVQQQQQQQMYYNSNSWNQWSDEIKQVYEYFENRLIKMLLDISHKRKKPVHYIMWQEVINNNLQLPNDTIIQVWMGDMGDVMRATSMGYRVIYSTCWYLDHVEYGTKWPKYYQCDPVDQSYGYHIDEKKVLGGEAAFWSEYFTNENLLPLMWPRASAIAERLWSNKEVKNLDKASERLSEHRCRMIKRGINAGEISGPGYCLHSPPKRRLFNETMGCKGGNCSRSHQFVEIEDIQVHLSQRGGSLTDCGKLFPHGQSSVPLLLAVILVLLVVLVALTRSSSRLHRTRLCRNRVVVLAFVAVLLVYFLCYTTIWMRAFEFSGSIHKTVQEDKSGDKSSVNGGLQPGGNTFNDQNHGLPS